MRAPHDTNKLTDEYEELKTILLGEKHYTHLEEYESFKAEVFSKLDSIEALVRSSQHFEAQATQSKEAIIDIVSPNMGRIIKVSINNQIEALNQRIKEISDSITQRLSIRGIIKRLFRKDETISAQEIYPRIMQILIIDNGSGLLKANFDRVRLQDPDMMSAIITSVKTFAESSLAVDNAEIGHIDYVDFGVNFYPYGSYYYAIVLDGQSTPSFDIEIAEAINEFSLAHLSDFSDTPADSDQLNQVCKEYFESLCERLERK